MKHWQSMPLQSRDQTSPVSPVQNNIGSCFLKMLAVRSATGLQESAPPPVTSAVLYVSARYNGNGIVMLFFPL